MKARLPWRIASFTSSEAVSVDETIGSTTLPFNCLQAHLLHGRYIEDRRSVRGEVHASRHRDGSPAVGRAKQALAGLGATHPDMQRVARRAPVEFVIDGDVQAAARKRLFADLRMGANRTATHPVASRVQVAVVVD